MRILVALFIVAALAALGVEARITHRHVGALNHRLVTDKLNGRQELLSSVDPDAPEQWFTQVLDHFDGTNFQTWQQRYFVNDTYWNKETGPIFLMLGGEGPISPSYVNGHFMINKYAEEHNALIVAVEHRFYGKSIPNNSSEVSNLRFLSSQQALADVATFHAHLSTQLSISPLSPWIAFGGSYSGSLSAWLRNKYPHLISASFSASAPVLAQLDFPEYFQVVADSIGPTCSQKIQRGYARVKELVKTQDGKKKLQDMFNTCTPINSSDDVAQFLSMISNPYAETVQYNDDNRSGSAWNIPKLCSQLESVSDDLDAMVILNSVYTNSTTGPQCLEVSYEDFLKEMEPTSDGRSWTFQTCTEYGYYQTGELSSQPFPTEISLEFFLKMCTDIFNIPFFTPHIDFTNEYYGAKNIKASNTFFTNGNIDPWHILGLTSTTPGIGALSTVVYLTGTAHCADMYPENSLDVPDLVAVRVQQRQYLSKWLANYRDEINQKSTNFLVD